MHNPVTFPALLALSLLPAVADVITPRVQQRRLDGYIRVGDSSVPNGGWISDDHQQIRTDAASWSAQTDLNASTLYDTRGSGTMGINSPAISLGITHVTADGFAEGSYTATEDGAFADVSLLSTFGFAFEVNEPVHYRLTGTISAEQDDGRVYLDAWSLVSLRRVTLPGDGTTRIEKILVEETANNASKDFDRKGTLLPGFTYDVVALSEITLNNYWEDLLTGQGSASWSFNFEVTPVPEPAAGVAVALGLAGYAGWRRLRRD